MRMDRASRSKHMRCFIYGLVHPNDPLEASYVRYIGKTNLPRKRLTQHVRDGRISDRKKLYFWIKDILSTGEKPRMLILEECELKDWKNKEREWIEKYQSNLFNILPGGCGPEEIYEATRKKMSASHLGKKATKQARENISKALKGRTFSEEHRKNLSEAQKRRAPPTQATREKISKTTKGRTFSDETRRKLSRALTGRTFSPESRRKMSESRMGRIITKEWRENLRKAMLGRHISEETKLRMSLAQKKRWSNLHKKTS